MNSWNTIPTDEILSKTVAALQEHNISAMVVENAAEAKQKALELIPQGAEVLQATSITLDTTGISEAINTSGKYNAIKPKLMQMNRQTQGGEMQKIGSAPEYVIGSVHAVTEDGKLLIASNTGSQLAAESYGASHVVFVVGAQKVVKNIDEGIQRINDYVLPQESERANKAYNITSGSFVSKLLIINREVSPNRTSLILVKESLGF